MSKLKLKEGQEHALPVVFMHSSVQNPGCFNGDFLSQILPWVMFASEGLPEDHVSADEGMHSRVLEFCLTSLQLLSHSLAFCLKAWPWHLLSQLRVLQIRENVNLPI